MTAASWATVPVAQAIKGLTAKVKKVPRSEYKDTGLVPVVDQGRDEVAGYWDDESDAYHPETPIIIFGDHTRSLKLIDFPFVLGADGTKPLTPSDESWNPQYLFYALKALEIPSRGYNRHFNALKEQKIVKPPLPDQLRIAAILSLAERAVVRSELVVDALLAAKRSIQHCLFDSGPPEVDSPDWNPRHWPEKQIDDMCERIKAGGTPSRSNPDFWNGNVPFVKIEDITRSTGLLEYTEEYLTQAGLDSCSAWIVEPGNVLVSIYATIGATAVPTLPVATNQAILGLVPKPDVASNFLRHALEHHAGDMTRLNVQSTQKNLSKQLVASYAFPLPSTAVQEQIASVLDACDRRLRAERRYLDTLGTVFQSLAHKLMSNDEADLDSAETIA